jgi:hypothetical protein
MWPEAVQAYQAAVSSHSEWQVGCVSLSHALQRSGDRSGATRVAEKCLQLKVDDPDYEDGWWRYHFGQSHRVENMLEEWRKKVMQ